jgi:3-oxoacyl-[acyl-carrier protein] reductase
VDLGLAGIPAAVAGASRGLGYAVAFELAQEGARVAICSRDYSGSIKEAARKIESATGSEVHAISADVAEAEGARRFVDQAAELLGGLQVLVANAGGPPAGPATQFDDEAWFNALELNFLSAVRMSRAALSHLRAAPWGRIVFMTSIVVKQPASDLALSSAVRSATTGFSKTLADELAEERITVNCVMPGQILTDRLRSLADAPADAGPDHPAFQGMTSKIPLGRLGTPEEFAAVVAFLCSKRASFVNGVALQIDGGFYRGLM